MHVGNLVIVAAVLLQGCAMPDAASQPDPVQADLSSCHAVGLDGLIGSPVSVMPSGGDWSALRVIRPGMMVTMDYSATRLNVRVDGRDTILDLTCG